MRGVDDAAWVHSTFSKNRGRLLAGEIAGLSKAALEAIRGELTLTESAAKHGIHQTMIAAWKKLVIEGMAGTFPGKAEAPQATSEAELARLHAKTGQLVIEKDFLSKASGRRASTGGV